MKAAKADFPSVPRAVEAIDALGSNNSELMATRAIHINVFLKEVPGDTAKTIKKAYNEIGAEAAISSDAYYEVEGTITDMIVMGTVYQHREARRVLSENTKVKPWIDAIAEVVEEAPETKG
jgi:hypothetical protein